MTYKFIRASCTEEMILNKEWPNKDEPATGWRAFRIEYLNEQGFSNIEGTVYIPASCSDPYAITDKIEEMLNEFTEKEYETPDE